MSLTLFNSLTRQKEQFKPIVANKIKMYVCGMTVYDDCHLGHARSMVAFDVIVRHLRFLGFEVEFVKNITDVDDKIIKRANENNESIQALTERVIASVREDEKALNVLRADIEPRATAYISEMISLIERLLQKDAAYLADNGDVLFRVKSFKEYGKLSKKDLEGQDAGHRIGVELGKEDPFDFVLWKRAKKGEPYWGSPFGDGRPGWHIECSAMIMNTLADTIDIHAGGGDLQFPHHENEIAQSETATGKPFANYWMHGGLLKIDDEKMSKSLGNFTTIKEALMDTDPEVLRYFLLSSHYRSALNYSDRNLEQAKINLEKLYSTLDRALDESLKNKLNETWHKKYLAAMNDDFNTPQAISVLFELSHQINKEKDEAKRADLANTLKQLGSQLGLFTSPPSNFLSVNLSAEQASQIEAKIKQRNEARRAKNFELADAIRDELLKENIEILDSEHGTSWRKKSS